MQTSIAMKWYTRHNVVVCYCVEKILPWLRNVRWEWKALKITGDESEKCMVNKSFTFKKREKRMSGKVLLLPSHTNTGKRRQEGNYLVQMFFFFIIVDICFELVLSSYFFLTDWQTIRTRGEKIACKALCE